MTLRRVFSASPYEDRIGYARAVVAPPFVLVSGCTSTRDGEVIHHGDAYAQTIEAFGVAAAALHEVGASLADTVRTRMYVKHHADVADVGAAHAELFGGIRPAATMVVVGGLVDQWMLVEVELDAYRPAPG